MSNYNASALLIPDEPLLVLPKLATKIGLNEAIVLQQVQYWLNPKRNCGKTVNGVRWIYNSYDQWQSDNFPFWSVRTLRRIFANLEEMGLLLSTDKLNDDARDRTKWYTINYQHDTFKTEQLPEAEIAGGQNDHMDSDNVAHSTYTEITAESDTPPPGHKITPQVKPLPSNGPEQQVVKAFYESIGVAQPPNYSKAIGQAKTILKTGIQPSEIPSMVAWAKTQWFAKDGFGLGDLARFAEQYRTSEGSVPGPTPTPDRELTQAELREFKRWDEGWQAVYGADSEGFFQWQRDFAAGTLRQRGR